MNNIIKRVWNQNRMVNIEGLSGAAFQAEDGGHTFQISGIDDTGATVSLSGTVAGVFRRPDNADIVLTGSASGGVASVTLTDDCYAVPGRFGLTIFVTSGGQKTAVYACIGTVANTSGGAVAGETPQDVVDLINAISAAVATIPPSYTDLMAAIAPTYSSSALYAVGSYAWYDGDLYRCTTAITTAETWTASHWTITDIGGDIVHLRNVISSKTGNLLPDYSADSWTSPTSILITRNGYALIINGTKENAGAVTITDQFALGAGSYEFGVGENDALTDTGAFIQIYSGDEVIAQTQTKTSLVLSTAKNVSLRILLNAGSTFNNLSVKPMLFSGSIPNTYVPQVSAHDYVARNNVGEALSSISNLSNATAQAYSTSATYSVGDYVWHDGSLYRCITPITTAETWTAAHWTAAVLGDDVGDLKSANGESITVYSPTWIPGNVNVNGTFDDTATTYRRTDFIDVNVLNGMPIVNSHPTYSGYLYEYSGNNTSNFIKYTQILNNTTTIFTPDSATKYVVLRASPAIGTSAITYYTMTTGYAYAKGLKPQIDAIDSRLVGLENVVIVSKNILSRNNFQNDSYINASTGAIVSYANWKVDLDYLSVVPGKQYMVLGFTSGAWSANVSAYSAFYDKDKVFTHGGVFANNSYLTAQDGDTYLRISAGNGWFMSDRKLMVGTTDDFLSFVGSSDSTKFVPCENYLLNDANTAAISELNDRVDELEKLPEIVFPASCVAVVGTQFNIYNENVIICDDLSKYDVFWTVTPYTMTYHVMSDCLRFTPEATHAGNTYTIGCFVKDKATWETIVSKTMNLTILTNTTLTSKTVVFIGDSLTNAGYYPYEIQHNISSDGVTSIGTRTSRPYFNDVQVTVNHEGRGGWSAKDYVTRASWGDDVNAFWNPSTSKFDFAYWLSNNNYMTPNVVFLNLGTNGVYLLDDNFAAMQEIIDSIRASSATVPIVINLITPPATQDGWDYIVPGGSAAQFAKFQMAYIKKYIEEYDDSENDHIYLTPSYFNIDRYHDYNTTEVAVSARNPELVTIQTNNVHLSKYGYFKMADVFWGTIQKVLTN